jgi:hypothetical protein
MQQACQGTIGLVDLVDRGILGNRQLFVVVHCRPLYNIRIF